MLETTRGPSPLLPPLTPPRLLLLTGQSHFKDTEGISTVTSITAPVTWTAVGIQFRPQAVSLLLQSGDSEADTV